MPSTWFSSSPVSAFSVTGSNTTNRQPQIRNRNCAPSSPRNWAAYPRTSRQKSDQRRQTYPTRLASGRTFEVVGQREQEIDADQQKALEPGGLAVCGDRPDDEPALAIAKRSSGPA